MERHSTRLSALFASCIALSVPALAQAPPDKSAPVPQQEMRDPKACTHARARIDKDGDITVGKPEGGSMSQQLARSDGVICPPSSVDPGIKVPTPETGAMPVIPPPGTGDPAIRPK